jgi:integrase
MAVFKSKCKACVKPCEHGRPRGKCSTCKTPCTHAGIWYYRFQIRGQRYCQAVPEARTKWQAEQAEAKAKDDVFNRRYGNEPSGITLKEFVEKIFLPWAKEEKRSWRNDVSRAKPILAYFKNKRMREITEINVRAYKKERLASSNGRGELRAPASVDRELQLLSRMFSLAVERGLIHANPCRGIKLCSVGNVVVKYLTAEQEEKLRPFLTGRRKHLLDILTIDLYTGMRRTELLSLHKSQIDFIRNEIVLIRTKSGRARTVPIHPDIRPILQRLSNDAGANGYLFENSKTGRPITDIKRAWRSALRDAGIPHMPFHCAGRHTFGTRAAEGGASPKDIQEIMGHASIITTMRYVHATDQGKRRTVDAAVRGKIREIAPQLEISGRNVAEEKRAAG